MPMRTPLPVAERLPRFQTFVAPMNGTLVEVSGRNCATGWTSTTPSSRRSCSTWPSGSRILSALAKRLNRASTTPSTWPSRAARASCWTAISAMRARVAFAILPLAKPWARSREATSAAGSPASSAKTKRVAAPCSAQNTWPTPAKKRQTGRKKQPHPNPHVMAERCQLSANGASLPVEGAAQAGS